MKRQITALVFQAKAFDTIEEMNKRENIPLKVETIQDDLDIYREIIGCDYVEITGRCIGNGNYVIICDESGRYADNVVFTIVSDNGHYLDVPGTVIITGPVDTKGELTSLSQKDIGNIVSCVSVTVQEVGGVDKYVPAIIQSGQPIF